MLILSRSKPSSLPAQAQTCPGSKAIKSLVDSDCTFGLELWSLCLQLVSCRFIDFKNHKSMTFKLPTHFKNMIGRWLAADQPK